MRPKSIPECYYSFFGSDERLSYCKCSPTTAVPRLCQSSNSFLDYLDNIKSKPSFLIQSRVVSKTDEHTDLFQHSQVNKETDKQTDLDYLNYKSNKPTGAFLTAAISSFKQRVHPGKANTNLSFEKCKQEHIGDTKTENQLILLDSQPVFQITLKKDTPVSCQGSSMMRVFNATFEENEKNTFLTTPKEKQETLQKKIRKTDTKLCKEKHDEKQRRHYKSRERKQLNRQHKPNVGPEFNTSVQTKASNQKLTEIDITVTNSDQLAVVAEIILGALNQNCPHKDDHLLPTTLHIGKLKPLKQLNPCPVSENKNCSKRRQLQPRTSPRPIRIVPYLSTKKNNPKPFSLRDSFQKRFSRKDKHLYYPFTEHSIKKKSKLLTPCYSVQLCLDRLSSFYEKEWHKRLANFEENSLSRKCKCHKRSSCRKKPQCTQAMFRQFEEDIQCEIEKEKAKRRCGPCG